MKYRPKKDIVAVQVPKGKRDVYKMAAAELGLSLSMLVQYGVEEYIRNHEVSVAIEKPVVEETLTDAEIRLSKNFAKLPKSVQRRFAGLIQDFAKNIDKKRPKGRIIY